MPIPSGPETGSAFPPAFVLDGGLGKGFRRRAEPLNRKDPVWRVEPIAGELTIHARPGLTLRGAGPRGLPLPDAVTEKNGSYTIDLGKTRGAFWLILD